MLTARPARGHRRPAVANPPGRGYRTPVARSKRSSLRSERAATTPCAAERALRRRDDRRATCSQSGSMRAGRNPPRSGITRSGRANPGLPPRDLPEEGRHERDGVVVRSLPVPLTGPALRAGVDTPMSRRADDRDSRSGRRCERGVLCSAPGPTARRRGHPRRRSSGRCRRVDRVGGAQGIAAMASGTEPSVRRRIVVREAPESPRPARGGVERLARPSSFAGPRSRRGRRRDHAVEFAAIARRQIEQGPTAGGLVTWSEDAATDHRSGGKDRGQRGAARHHRSEYGRYS